MEESKQFEVIFYNGRVDGIRSIRKQLSTITAYIIPRSQISEVGKLDGVDRHCIYFLLSEDAHNNILKIYVGQTTNGKKRLNDHNRKKGFWNKAILFVADNNTFTLDIINGLEGYIIKKVNKDNRFKVENAANPKSEIDKSILLLIKQIYEEMQFIMAASGCGICDDEYKRYCCF